MTVLEPGTGLMGNGEGPGFGRDLRGDTGYGDTQGFDSVRVLVLKINVASGGCLGLQSANLIILR